MRHVLTTGLVLLAISGATSSFSQKRSYSDDIYSDPKPEKPKKEVVSQQSDPGQNTIAEDDRTYSSSDRGSYDSRNNSKQYSDEYSDNDDDYYYSSRINRFYHPFYNRPYYSSFYNPNWYDPYWVDPYWGWSPWQRPGFSVSFGAGPYWSSYWGWSSWYGCGNFGSYYGYPGYSMYGGFYSGYWNGYYAGLYNNYGYGRGGYRTISYGPRYSLNATNNHFSHNVGSHGFRREIPIQSGQSSGVSGPRSSGFRNTNAENERPVRENGAIRADRAPRGSEPIIFRERGESRTSNNDRGQIDNAPRGDRSEGRTAPAMQSRPERSGWFGRGERTESPARQERSYSQPRFESSPSRSVDRGGRSFDGGGRSFDGGGRSSGGGSGGGRSAGGRR